jgi:NAD(P)-dependent dehydrogenase (short-subunit alcohol dehydrogenase family)
MSDGGRNLAGKVAVITGGGRGIGAVIAAALASRGASLALIGRTGSSLAATAEDIRARHAAEVCCETADVSREDDVKAAFARIEAALGAPSILINNAGIAPSSPFLKSSATFWREVLDVDLMSAVYASQAAIPGMLKTGWGRIVNISSVAGLTGKAYITAYCAAKHAMIGLTRSLAIEFARKGITVNAVCPSYTDTDIVTNAVNNIAAKTGRSSEDALSALVDPNPQGRLIRPEEVADTVVWLCGNGAESVNGQSIVLAGGELMP